MIIPYTSTRLSGATNTLVACETQLGFLGDGPVLNAVRAFLAT